MTRPASRLVPTGFFVLRTPLLSFDTLAGHAVEGRPDDRRKALAAVLRRPEIREAIHLASPRVEAAIDGWLGNPHTGESRRLEPVLAAYALRAATRPAPFGIFAGWTTGTVGPSGASTGLRLQGLGRYRRSSRLDMDHLVQLAAAVATDPERRWRLPHRSNSSLHGAAGRLHLAASRYRDGHRSYHLVAVDTSPHLTATLERADRPGTAGVALGELAEALVDGDITLAEARAFLDELVDHQVLVADLDPPLTVAEPGPHVAASLAAIPATASLAGPLEEAHLRLAALDDRPLDDPGGPPAGRYAWISAALADLPGGAPSGAFVHVDLAKPAESAVLGPEVAAAIREGVELLHRFAGPADDPGLARFREEFTARYGTRTVPLTEALDEEAGIGFERIEAPAAEAPELLGDIPFPPAEDTGDGRWTPRHAALLRMVGRAWRDGAIDIELSAADIVELQASAGGPPLPLPGALSAIVRLAAGSADELAAGRFRVHLPFAGGPSGVEFLGRFCGADKALRAGVEAHLRAEEAQQPGAVFAEIVHCPEGRVGNILVRPQLRRYEIPYLGRSGAPPEAQIPVTDLVVSVRDERIVLESRRRGLEVLPRLTTAHLHSRPGLPVYRFLARLQYQGVASEVAWDWGPLAAAPFLPRVVHGRVVLALARWAVRRGDLAVFRSAGPERAAALAAWRAAWRVPRFVALVDGEDELVIDLEDGLSLDVLAHHVRNRTEAVLVEMFPTPDELCVTGPEGRFVSEVIVPFINEAAASDDGDRHFRGGAVEPARPGKRRRFPPGSEWLYAKLYTGAATADRVLLGAVAPVAAEALGSEAAARWFFIRYADPEPHLRVRFAGDPDGLREAVLPALEEAAGRLVEDGLVWRVQLDTYEREVERYGGDHAIELAEDIFAADSDAVIALLGGPGGLSGDVRWRSALAGLTRLFDDLGLTLDEQRRISADARSELGAELDVDGPFAKAVSRRFRSERAGLEALLAAIGGSGPPPAAEVEAIRAAFDRRSVRVGPMAVELRRLAAAGKLSVPLEDLAWSLGHMHVNRILRAAPRAQELVLYEFLDRLLAARAARSGPCSGERSP